MKTYTHIHPKDQIVEFMQRVYDCGMTTTSGGNISIVDENGDMWISPGGIDKGSLTRDDIVCVKPDGTIVGRHKPSSEYPFHRAVYNCRKDVRAVLHAHPPALVSLSVAGMVPEIDTCPTFASVCRGVSFAPYEIPGSVELGRNLAAEFAKGVFSVILENHGACVAGASLAEAFARLEALDFCARTTINAHRLGKTKHLPAAKSRRGKIAACACDAADLPCPPAEADLRFTAAKLVRRAYRQQLFMAAGGLLALRTGDGFIVNACGTDRAHVAPEDFVPGDCKLLSAIFKAQPEVNAIAMATPPSLMGYAVTDAVFDPRVIPESYILLREMPTLEANATDREIARTISPRTPAIILRNRCAMTIGKNALEAFDRLEVAEYSAKAAISAGLFGGLRPIGKKEVADLVAAFKLIP